MGAARVCVVVLGLAAFAIALRSTTIHELVETASSVGRTGLTVVVLFGVHHSVRGAAAALAALVTGATVWLAGMIFSFTSVPYVLAVALAALAYVVVGLLPARSTHA